MAYTAKDAIQTFEKYLQNSSIQNKIEIEGTKNRGLLITTQNGESFVIFIYPLVHKQDNTKNYFDTRDSGAAEREIAWNYAIANGYKYFCLGVNDQVSKYQGFIFSLECHETRIEQLSGTENGNRITNGPGNQIIIPNDYIPSKPFERIQNKLGIYLSVIQANNLLNYISLYDNRPYLSSIPVEELCNYDKSNNSDSEAISYKTNLKLDKNFSRNRIIFGAPGTGKSYSLNNDRQDLLGKNNECDYERVTFHPDYSYANFVGTYKPVTIENNTSYDIDNSEREILMVLQDKNISAQCKYDELKNNPNIQKSVAPILVSFCNGKEFETDRVYDAQKGHGIALRQYLQLKTLDPKSSEISYEYVPGPFMRLYVKALKNAQDVAKGTASPRPFLLIIEEINRANVAAVFGDVFQLLDRKDNISEYPIQASEDIKKYLAKELGGNPEDYAKIKIPDNMFIWATMNSADQGVFPMDTAFKRRWDFTYLGIDDNDEELKDKFVSMIHHGEQKFVEWNSLRMAINEFLANEKINEDKQLGPYFIAKDIVVPASGNEIDTDKFNDVFKHKVLMYLFDDAAKQKRSKLFEGISAESSRYSKICKAFEEKGVDIFHSSIRDMVITRGYLHEEIAPEHLNETEDWKESDE